MKKNTILLFTLLLFIVLFNGLAAKDHRAEITKNIEELQREFNRKITLFETELIHKENKITSLENHLVGKEKQLQELTSQINHLYSNNPNISSIYRSEVSNIEKIKELPALFRQDKNVLTK
ncbi:hypothetical protein SAMN05216389_109116 [Oceanobacillus limi]|uniref:Uncharacterized protein n=1 Tax=Oceanobacillus limi TaxID=930131 RepID=A0A1I0DR45_9BACI|nr:hypothetical protein [Oceanobacillus limi]SET35062.1 hypothetical protein SAMN05216389_109116 [Oceanobacillus limi]